MIFTLGVAVVAALPAAPATAVPARPAAPHSPAAAARPASPEAEFLIAVHQGNLAQIAAGRLAARKSANPAVRKLAKRFASYHKKLDSQVKKVARGMDVRLPKQPNSEQTTLAGQYEAAPADRFDTLFIESQLSAYERASRIAGLFLKVSTDPAVRAIVTKAQPVIEENLAALTAARDQLASVQPRQ
jgi:putative membrane protein